MTAQPALPFRLCLLRSLSVLQPVRGWKRFCRRLAGRSLGDTVDHEVDNDGLKFMCNPRSFLEYNLIVFRDYEGPEKALFLGLFEDRPHTTLLDVGANIGIHSLTFSRRFDRVVCFEPNPEVFDRLQTNLNLNQASNVTPLNIGLSNEQSELTFYKPLAGHGTGNMGMGTFDPGLAPKANMPVTLPVRRGDDVVSELALEKIDALKIDVQGLEPLVLKGLRATLERDRPVVWFEAEKRTIANITEHGGLKALIPYGFKLYTFQASNTLGLLRRARLTPAGDGSALVYGNYVIVPE